MLFRSPSGWTGLEYIEGKDVSQLMEFIENNYCRKKSNNFFGKIIYLCTPPLFNTIKYHFNKKFIKK